MALNTQHLSRLKQDAITVGFSPRTGCTTTVGSFEDVVISSFSVSPLLSIFFYLANLHKFPSPIPSSLLYLPDSLQIAVTNCTSAVLYGLSLYIQLLNMSKPQKKHDVSGFLAWVGPLQVAISELPPGIFAALFIVVRMGEESGGVREKG